MNPSNRARFGRSSVTATSTTPAPQTVAPSRSRPSIATAASAPIPEYQPLQHPLNPASQQAIARLQVTHKLDDVQRRLKLANEVLSECAGDLNDRFVEREKRVRAKAKGRKDGEKENEGGYGEGDEEIDVERLGGTQGLEEMERGLEEMREKVTNMTARMEEHLRKVVDAQKGLIDIGDVLAEVRTISPGDVHTASELGSASQQRQPRSGMREDMDDDCNEGPEDSTMRSFEPTLDGSSRPTQKPPRAPSQLFKELLQQKKDQYQTLTLTSRYSKHNDYIGFKRTVHDAIHGDDGPPLPPPSKWFDDHRGAPTLGNQLFINSIEAKQNEESDDDIAIEREKISTKCPITFTELIDPVTSTKCPHTFERSAINALIQQSTYNIHGHSIGARHRSGETRAVQCPVAGCFTTLTGEDLRVDQALVRKIRRLQEGKRRLEREDDDDSDVVSETPASGKRPAPPEDTSSGLDGDVDMEMEQRVATEREMRSTTAVPTSTTQSMVIDLSD